MVSRVSRVGTLGAARRGRSVESLVVFARLVFCCSSALAIWPMMISLEYYLESVWCRGVVPIDPWSPSLRRLPPLDAQTSSSPTSMTPLRWSGWVTWAPQTVSWFWKTNTAPCRARRTSGACRLRAAQCRRAGVRAGRWPLLLEMSCSFIVPIAELGRYFVPEWLTC